MNIFIIGGAHAGNLQYAINYCDFHRDYNLEPEYTIISLLNGFEPRGVDKVEARLDQKFAGIDPTEEFLVFMDPLRISLGSGGGGLWDADVQRAIDKLMQKLSNYHNARMVIITDSTPERRDECFKYCIEAYKASNCKFKILQRAITMFNYTFYNPGDMEGGAMDRLMLTVRKLDVIFQLMRHEEYWKSGCDFEQKQIGRYNLYLQNLGDFSSSAEKFERYNLYRQTLGNVSFNAKDINKLPQDYEPYNEDNFNKKMARLRGDSSNRSEELVNLVSYLLNQEVFKETGFDIYLKKVREQDMPAVMSRGVPLKLGYLDYEVDSYHKVYDSKATDQSSEINYMCNILCAPNKFIKSGILVLIPKDYKRNEKLYIHIIEKRPERDIRAIKSEYIVASYKQDCGLHLELKNPGPMVSLLSSANESTY